METAKKRVKVSPHVSVARKPNGYYYAIIKRKGRTPIEMSLGTKNRDEAKTAATAAKMEQLAAHMATESLTQDVIQRLLANRKMALGKAADDVLASMELEGKKKSTISSTRDILVRFLRTEKLTDEPVSMLDAKHIDHFLNKRMIGQKLSSRRRAAWAVEVFCTHMCNNGLIHFNPAAKIALKTEGVEQKLLMADERKPFTLEELDRILMATKPGEFWWCAIQIVMQTGLRLSDIVNLQWASIRGDQLVIVTGKRGVTVSHPLTPTLRAVFNSIPRHPGSAYMFTEMMIQHGKSPTYLSQQFLRLCRKLGIQDRSFHSLRHTFALARQIEERSRIKQQLMDEVVADLALKNTQAALGHQSPASTQHYLNHPHADVVKP